jgi:hypothetical protein
MSHPRNQDITEKIAVKRGSGNVFADLGFEHPEEEKLRAQLAREIRDIGRGVKEPFRSAHSVLR